MLTEYAEKVQAERSLREGRLVLVKRFYLDDYFGSSIPGYLGATIALVSFWQGTLSISIVVVASLLILVSVLALRSVAKSYELKELQFLGSADSARDLSALIFERLHWHIRLNNKKYLYGFVRPSSWSPFVVVVIYDEGRLWICCRSGSVHRFGRIPFREREIRKLIAEFSSHLEGGAVLAVA